MKRPAFTQHHFCLQQSSFRRCQRKGSGAGFTLVELLVYIGITAIALVIFTNFAATTSQSAARSKIVQELQQNARLILDRLTQEVRGARSWSTSGGNLTLVYPCPAGTCNHIFAQSGTTLTLDTDGTAQPLHSTKVAVTSWQVTGTPPSPVTVSITLNDTLSTPPQSITVTTSLIPHQQLY